MTEEAVRDENALRSQIINQLEESLVTSREMMMNLKLDPRTRERWTQLHTNTAQVLNTVLRDRQYEDWEKRLKELEAAGHLPRKSALTRYKPTDNSSPSMTVYRVKRE
jgi:hypothetical protein